MGVFGLPSKDDRGKWMQKCYVEARKAKRKGRCIGGSFLMGLRRGVKFGSLKKKIQLKKDMKEVEEKKP